MLCRHQGIPVSNLADNYLHAACHRLVVSGYRNGSCTQLLHFTNPSRILGATMLDELGKTPDEVARSLQTLGIQGVRNTARFLNPIVRYAHTVVTDVYGIDLTLGDRLRIVFANGDVSEVPVPAVVLEFLELFHRGHYPELEMPLGPG